MGTEEALRQLHRARATIYTERLNEEATQAAQLGREAMSPLLDEQDPHAAQMLRIFFLHTNVTLLFARWMRGGFIVGIVIARGIPGFMNFEKS